VAGGAKWTLSADGSKAVSETKKVADGFGGVEKQQKSTLTSSQKLAVGIVTLNQAFDFASRVLGGLSRAYDATIGNVADLINEQAALADDLAKTARALGMSTQTLQDWRVAAGYAGIESGVLDKSILRINKTLVDAGRGLSTATDLLGMIGIEAHDSSGQLKDGTDVLLEMADAFESGLIPAQQQAAIASQLLGDRTGYMSSLLRDGREAIADAADELERYGAYMSDDMLYASEEYGDSVERLDLAQQGVKNTISQALTPVFTAFNNTMAESVGTGGSWRAMLSSVTPIIDELAITVFGFIQGLLRLPTIIEMTIEAVVTASLIVLRDLMAEIAGMFAKLGMESMTAKFASAAVALTAPIDRMTGMLLEAIQELHEAGVATEAFAERLAELRAGGTPSGGGGGGGGGDGDGAGADIVVQGGTAINLDDLADFTIQGGTVIDPLAEQTDTAIEQADQLALAWGDVQQMVRGTVEQVAALAQNEKSATDVMASIVQIALDVVGQVTGPVGSAVTGVASGLFSAFGGSGDAGLMPTLADTGAMPGLGGSHSLIIRRNDEVVMDPEGTRELTRTQRLVNDMITQPGGIGSGGGFGGGSVRVVDDRPVMIDGQVLMRIVGERLYRTNQGGRGYFTDTAFEGGR
jgi:hypothetical protein